ncbi:MAG: non-canonical purine NTP pyrophosphatase, RdgB/HAM1 family [Robiginitomaculum sp.]|nr:MAG: non-canonical purine NTP pyrophosphatase, RdgB/HAM1 family [Robiginitomaculum sp.]
MLCSKVCELVLASHNSGKIVEFEDLFRPIGMQMQSALALGLPDVEETGSSFEENAVLKALDVARRSKKMALGDDSGLCVAALGGDPGIYTARWAEQKDGSRDWYSAMSRVAEKLREQNASDWSASFVCVLALAFADGRQIVERGEVHGKLVWPLRGTRGFGFDPMFVPDGEAQTFGEMDPDKKNAMSHRHVAFQKLLRHDLF